MNQSIDEGIQSGSEIRVNETLKIIILGIAKWARFIGISGLVLSGLILLFSVVGGIAMGSSFSGIAPFGNAGGMGGAIVFVIYFFTAIIYFFMFINLYRFANKVKSGLDHSEINVFINGFKNLKSFFVIIGVLLIISFGLIIISILTGLIAALSGF